MMEVIDLFPKTITAGYLDSLNADEIENVINFLDTKNYKQEGVNGGLSEDQQILDNDIFTNIKKEIIQKSEQFARQSFGHIFDNLQICNSWSNTVHQNEGIQMHRHMNSYMSGVFYVTKGSPITFSSMNDNTFSILPECIDISRFPRSQSTFTIHPEPGLVILFPSGLYHMVHQSNDNNTRHSIAFNLIPVGKIGSQTNILTFS